MDQNHKSLNTQSASFSVNPPSGYYPKSQQQYQEDLYHQQMMFFGMYQNFENMRMNPYYVGPSYHKKSNYPRNHFNDQAERVDKDVSKYEWVNDFPRVSDYNNKEELQAKFPHLTTINPENFDINEETNNAQYFVLRSTNHDDIHKAIKYQKWTSTSKNNDTLQKAWKESKGGSFPIYLFFSVVKSNQFLGVAKLASEFSNSDSFEYWWEGAKWFGSMKLEWLFIKEIKSEQLEHIKDSGSQTVTQSKDCTKLPPASGNQLLNIFAKAQPTPNLFKDFPWLDAREDCLITQRNKDEEFKSIFKTRSEEYKQNSSSYYDRKGPKYSNYGGYKGDNRYGKRNYGAKTYYPSNQMGMQHAYPFQFSGYYPQGQPQHYYNYPGSQAYSVPYQTNEGQGGKPSYGGYNTYYNKNNHYERGGGYQNSTNNNQQQQAQPKPAQEEQKAEITEKFFVKEKGAAQKANKNKKKKKVTNKNQEGDNFLNNNQDDSTKGKIIVNNDSDEEIDFNQEFQRKNLNEDNPVLLEQEKSDEN